MSGGIYQITNLLNGKRYIGSAINLKKRWRAHLGDLRRGQHKNQHLQRAFYRYGGEAFVFSVLEYVQTPDQLIEREQHYLDIILPQYNIAPIAGSSLGVKHTQGARRNMSKAHKGERGFWYGKHHSDDTKRKISKAKKDKALSAQTRARMSEGWTPERRQAQSDQMKGMGNPNYGKPLTAECRQKLSAALMGNQNAKGAVRSAETRRKLSEATRAYWHRVHIVHQGGEA